jgi:hypothetical protein
MTMTYFGDPWPSPFCDGTKQSPTPVGLPCIRCEEPIQEGDSGVFYANQEPTPAHRNCFLRATIGSVAHIQRRCGCYVPGSTEGDPEGMTRREAADAAVAESMKSDFRKSAEKLYHLENKHSTKPKPPLG